MPEGHTIHRLAKSLNILFGDRQLQASSPQGRFAQGAARLDGQVFISSYAHGKHLLAAFAPAADVALDSPAITWLHTHLGLYGAWNFDGDATFVVPEIFEVPDLEVGSRQGLPGIKELGGHSGGSALAGLTVSTRAALTQPEGVAATVGSGKPRPDLKLPEGKLAPGQWQPAPPKGAVRLRLVSKHGVADLSGPTTCELLDLEGVKAVEARLGPDPLAPGETAEGKATFIANVRQRRRAIGELLMDQSVIAGVGNIYRAESLFRAGISPRRQGVNISAQRLSKLWDDNAALMAHGVATGLITTVNSDDVPEPLPPDDPEAGRWYVYHRTGRPCLRCGTPIAGDMMQGRTLFWCPRCQGR